MRIIRPALYFDLDGTPSQTPAWRMTNELELLKPADVRGTEPDIIPGRPGALPNPLREDATERTINGQVFGHLDPDGEPYPAEIDGLVANLRLLADAWAAVPTTADSLRVCTLYLPDGTTRTGPVQVLNLDWPDFAEMPIVTGVVLRLLLPDGALA